MNPGSVNRASVRWLVLEGLAVVLSILLAFSIDAWWEDKQQRNDEQIILQSLLDDLRDKDELLDDNIKYTQAILESTIKLLDAESIDGLKSEEIDRLIANTWWYHDPSEWNSAPLNSLVAGGEYSIISNVTLLQELALLHLTFETIGNQYKNDENFLHSTYIPFLISEVNLSQIAMASDHVPGHPQSAYVFPDLRVSDHYDHAEIVSDIEFKNMLVARIDRLLDIQIHGYAEIGELLDKVTMLIEQELDH